MQAATASSFFLARDKNKSLSKVLVVILSFSSGVKTNRALSDLIPSAWKYADTTHVLVVIQPRINMWSYSPTKTKSCTINIIGLSISFVLPLLSHILLLNKGIEKSVWKQNGICSVLLREHVVQHDKKQRAKHNKGSHILCCYWI